MKITVNEENGIQFEEVSIGITLKTNDGEKLSICMRDSGLLDELYRTVKYE